MLKTRKGFTIICIVFMILGLGLLLYPTISDAWNRHVSRSLVNEYDASIAEKSEEDIDNIRKLAEAYNRTLIGNVLPDAFAELQLPPDATYDSMLDPTGSGYMGTVEIPAIRVNLPIYHYTVPEVLEKGVGHLAGSSLPVGGRDTHSVLSAHRGLPSARLFTDLDRLKEGDVFYLHVLEETLAYEVDQIKVIEPTETDDLSIERGKDYCTLLTCTPYAVNTHRLIVRGHRIPYTEELHKKSEAEAAAPSALKIIIRILCALAGIALAAAIIFVIRKRQKVLLILRGLIARLHPSKWRGNRK